MIPERTGDDGEGSLGAESMPADIPPFETLEGRYLVRFARSPEEVQRARSAPDHPSSFLLRAGSGSGLAFVANPAGHTQ